MKLNKYIDHTLLTANATRNQISNLCEEAKKYDFYAICINGCYVSLAKEHLKNTNIKIAATVGFPLGASHGMAKTEEARIAVKEGADEIDMVINIGLLLDGKLNMVRGEIADVKKVIGEKNLKVIIETCYLNPEEIAAASQLVMEAGADFVKTSTGFGSRGASLEDIENIKAVTGDKLKIKASGGIKDRETAKQYIALGVDRIGTSSGVNIVTKN